MEPTNISAPDPAPAAKPHLLYANGFQISLSTADTSIMFQRNGQNVMLVNLSYTTTKSLAKGLLLTIERLEKTTKHEIMTVDDVVIGLKDFVKDSTQ